MQNPHGLLCLVHNMNFLITFFKFHLTIYKDLTSCGGTPSVIVLRSTFNKVIFPSSRNTRNTSRNAKHGCMNIYLWNQMRNIDELKFILWYCSKEVISINFQLQITRLRRNMKNENWSLNWEVIYLTPFENRELINVVVLARAPFGTTQCTGGQRRCLPENFLESHQF